MKNPIVALTIGLVCTVLGVSGIFLAVRVMTAKQLAEKEKRVAAELAAKQEAEAKAELLAEQEAKEAKLEIERMAIADAERRNRLSRAALTIWEETEHETISILSARLNEATIRYRNIVTNLTTTNLTTTNLTTTNLTTTNLTTTNLKYVDMPDWLRVKAQDIYRKEGESKGLIREVNGKEYDLRTNPAGWVTIHTAKVVQIADDSYLMVNEAPLPNFGFRYFKLKTNGLPKLLRENERVKVVGLAIGSITYKTAFGGQTNILIYDSGKPIGTVKDGR
jgi:hypothetical protein